MGGIVFFFLLGSLRYRLVTVFIHRLSVISVSCQEQTLVKVLKYFVAVSDRYKEKTNERYVYFLLLMIDCQNLQLRL